MQYNVIFKNEQEQFYLGSYTGDKITSFNVLKDKACTILGNAHPELKLSEIMVVETELTNTEWEFKVVSIADIAEDEVKTPVSVCSLEHQELLSLANEIINEVKAA